MIEEFLFFLLSFFGIYCTWISVGMIREGLKAASNWTLTQGVNGTLIGVACFFLGVALNYFCVWPFFT